MRKPSPSSPRGRGRTRGGHHVVVRAGGHRSCGSPHSHSSRLGSCCCCSDPPLCGSTPRCFHIVIISYNGNDGSQQQQDVSRMMMADHHPQRHRRQRQQDELLRQRMREHRERGEGGGEPQATTNQSQMMLPLLSITTNPPCRTRGPCPIPKQHRATALWWCWSCRHARTGGAATSFAKPGDTGTPCTL